ncbi:MAG: 30S ribosomal protein S1 [Deltaproteobacteria bacterium]|nr:30S ribosomal protein S1 [Deltaproteobacteria bacterium]
MTGSDEKVHTGDAFGDFETLFEGKVKELQEGGIVKGKIVQITKDTVLIDVGYKSEGHVPLREFLDKDGNPTIKVGDDIKVLLERREDEKGYIVLSKAKADQLKIWDEIIEAADSGKPMEGTITQRIKGGFYVEIGGVVCFLPGSQVDLKPVRNQDRLVGQKYLFKVLKYNRYKSNVIVSRRTLLEEERDALKKTTLEHLHEGSVVEGLVKNITEYGAFIDLGGIDGLIHLTDLSWGKIMHPTQVLKVGDRVTVKVLKYNKDDGKISLGLKQTKTDPWVGAKDRYPLGVKVGGRVVNLTDYGAFVELEEGLEGLVHISEMAWTKLRHPSQKFKVGDNVEVMVLDVDPVNKRISLGIKQIEANPWVDIERRYPKGTRVKGVVKNITDFGAFIGVEDGIDGLVHVSDISWKKIKHPSEAFKKGQEVEACVVNIDSTARRFSLSTKLLEKNPWEGVTERYKPGMTLTGKVTSVADFGAFVELEPGLEGLVHVSELNRGKKKGGGIQPGDVVEVEVLNVDPDDNKIGLSIRGVKDEPKEDAPGEAS